MRIAFADDDGEMREFMAQIFDARGFKYENFTNGRDLITALGRETFDVVLVDWNMPHKSGLDVVQWINENLSPPPPTIVITSRSSPQDMVDALNLGADDVIIKPESADVIIARIASAYRRANAHVPERGLQTYGVYQLNMPAQTASCNGEAIALTLKELQLAELLFRNCGKSLSRGYLMHRVWGSVENIASRTLDMHISRVRSKLNLRPESGYMIQTISRFGYRLEQLEQPADLQIC